MFRFREGVAIRNRNSVGGGWAFCIFVLFKVGGREGDVAPW